MPANAEGACIEHGGRIMADELELLSRISGERAKSLVEELSRIQMRVAGSERERRTADKIAEEFRKLGLEVALEEFPAISWEHGPSRLVMVDSGRSFETQMMPYSPLVPDGGVKGEIDFLRFGYPKEASRLADGPVIAIVDWNEDFGSIAQMLTAYVSGKNIVALGIISQLKQAYHVDGVPMLKKPIPFPIFSITGDDGDKIKEIAHEKKNTVRFEGRSEIIPDAVSANVVARKPGMTEPDTRIIVSGHHDGWFSGANDNLSAVASVLEVARVLVDVETRRSVEFISFGCEESGTDGYYFYLWGSRQYLKRHKENSDKIGAVLNAECAGASNSDFLIVDCTPDLLPHFQFAFEEVGKRPIFKARGYRLGVAIPPNTQADQISFSWNGIPGGLIYWSWYDQYHSDLDTADIIESDRMQAFAELYLLSCLRMADSPVLPLSITWYSKVLRVGHSDVTTYLSSDLRKATMPGINQLRGICCEEVDFGSLEAAVDSLSISAGQLEKALSNPDEVERYNPLLLSACQILNRGFCRGGGVFGEDPMFPGYLSYLEELHKIEGTIESLTKVSGADLPRELKAMFHPLFTPEVATLDFDVNDLLNGLVAARDRFREKMIMEIKRLAACVGEADELIRKGIRDTG